ncbi:TKL protein kinase [Phytophthora nicotianae INRA-310]|uniref:TKL protein kinase n=3 Tax=Phytophthora nicotianae TaxID=4792 RepID=W2QQR1_PHYN3|nr:TKL protein kinase [Phytophthora nicotianae INRA-310]ETN15448.1 TKL protein kinase [Phytophthora nicotianae INRA-310]
MGHLIEAVREGSSEAVQIALTARADVNLRDEEGWTALTLAAADGSVDLLEQLLVEPNVDIDYPNHWGETALSRAVFIGNERIAKLLLDEGAKVDLADEDGDTPLHVSVISGRLDLAYLLLENGADVMVKNKSGNTVQDLAHKYGRKDFVAILGDYRRDSMWTTVLEAGIRVSSYFGGMINAGIIEGKKGVECTVQVCVEQNNQHDEDKSKQSELSFTTLLPELLVLCAGMVETQDMCEDILERLQRVQNYFAENEEIAAIPAKDSFPLVTARFHAFLEQHSNHSAVERLASTRTILGLLRGFHDDIDGIVTQSDLADSTSIAFNWKEKWEKDVLAVENRLINSWKANSSELSRELPDAASQTGALLLLNSEAMRHKNGYSARSQHLLESASKKIARMSGAPIPEIPEWFIPCHEVQRHSKPFASGSYGSIYRGIWRGSKVVIKCMTVNTPFEKRAFLREAKIWHKARHPHIINFFGACCSSHPCFFVCEEAVNGNLAEYLDKKKSRGRELVWSKLHEAALGLEYLHQNGIVHGDLKCNQILINGEGTAKLTDFGFSFVLSESKPKGAGGATRWRAPECLGYKEQMPTFESDVYSFGMCVVEAMTYDVPWGVYLPDVAVVDHLRHRQFIPRPSVFSDAEWDFVLALCAFEPSKRIKLRDAIEQLASFASEETECCISLRAGNHNNQSMIRFSKKSSQQLLEDKNMEQEREAKSKVYCAMISLRCRRNYLRFRYAVQTIQIAFRYKKSVHLKRESMMRNVSADIIVGLFRMINERRKYLRFVCALRVLQCCYRYREKLRVKAAEPTTATLLSTESPSSPGHTIDLPQQLQADHSFTPQWVNDEERLSCVVCYKDFTVFRRKHHCRVCLEIICGNCSLTRKRMRVCVMCAGLRPPRYPTATQPQTDRRGRILSNAGGFLTGLGTLFQSRRNELEPHSVVSYGPIVLASTELNGQDGLWQDDDITAVRIPRDEVTILETLSRGAYGSVHLGTWNDKQVAIKTLLPESRKNLFDINQFLMEVKLIAAMEHPCIVNLFGVAWSSLADMCMILEYMDGGDLRSLLDKYKEDQHPLGFDANKLSIALNVVSALTYLHSLSPRVIHRDLKSLNILLNSALEAKVTDFGVSRSYEDRTMTAGVGTGLWMAPEVMSGEAYNEKADMFSFGIVLSELDTHNVPHAENSNVPPVRLMQSILMGEIRAQFSQAGPQAVVELGNACLSLDPADRPTAAEAMYKLHCILRDLS